MPDHENDGELQRIWTPSPGTRPVPQGDPFGVYADGNKAEPLAAPSGDTDDDL